MFIRNISVATGLPLFAGSLGIVKKSLSDAATEDQRRQNFWIDDDRLSFRDPRMLPAGTTLGPFDTEVVAIRATVQRIVGDRFVESNERFNRLLRTWDHGLNS